MDDIFNFNFYALLTCNEQNSIPTGYTAQYNSYNCLLTCENRPVRSSSHTVFCAFCLQSRCIVFTRVCSQKWLAACSQSYLLAILFNPVYQLSQVRRVSCRMPLFPSKILNHKNIDIFLHFLFLYIYYHLSSIHDMVLLESSLLTLPSPHNIWLPVQFPL